jgi:hypothetical protein
MRAFWLPVRHPFQANVARLPQGVKSDLSFGVVWNLLTGVAQMFHIRRGRGRIRWTFGERVFMRWELNADQVATRRRSEKLGMPKGPFGTQRWLQCTEELHKPKPQATVSN